MARAAPTMYVLAGPNGAGKSTLYRDRVQPITPAPFINADEIEKTWIAEGRECGPYEAAQEAARRRDEHLAQCRSFVTETVFSHENKLDLIRRAQTAGFKVILYHVSVRKAEFAVARVRLRVHEGGHGVPEDKILARFTRNQPLIREAATLADMAQVFDNSKRGQPPRWLFTLERGFLAARDERTEMPEWASVLYGIA